MKKISTIEQYIEQLSEERKQAIINLRKVISDNLPNGFVETFNYGMITYSVPHSTYPSGYHCDPKVPLPFISLASQKNYVAIYHMGLYVDEKLKKWFIEEFKKRSSNKLDMGKSCVRFKKLEQIPYDLIGELCKKITPEEWIKIYESKLKR